MASSKLKVEQREKLYYSKYTYKCTCYLPGAYYTYNVRNIDDYKDKISSLITDMRRYPMYVPATFGDKDLDNIKLLIDYQTGFTKQDKGTMRKEGNSISFFSNDLSYLEKLPAFNDNPNKITQVEVMPAGIKYFKRDIPAKYRVHFKEGKVSSELKQDILSYIQKTENVEASSSLMVWLNRPNHWNTIWVSKTFFINYNDPSNLTMMHILFPEVIGKNYKLEKK